MFGLLGLWLSDKTNWKNLRQIWQQPRTKVVVILFCLIGLRQWFTPLPLIGMWQWFSIASVGLLVLFLANYRTLLRAPIISAAIALTVAFQSTVGIAQFQLQHELVGYSLLGEPELSNYIGLARVTISGADRVLPYGTTAHPNVLAGFLAVYCLLLLTRWKSFFRMKRVLFGLALVLGAATLVLTTSVSGMATFVLGLLVQKVLPRFSSLRPWYISLGVCLTVILIPLGMQFMAQKYPNAPSLTRRTYLQIAGMRMFAHQPLWGTGLQTTTRFIEWYSPAREVVRFSQPPHHVGIAVLAETGVLGLVLLVLLITKKQLQPGLLMLIPVLSLDHYALTLVPGMLLVGLCILFVCYDSFNSD